jgi:phospholipase C
LLEEHGKTWRIYYDDTPQVWAFHELWDDKRARNWFTFDTFEEHVAKDDLPHYTFIEPNHRPPLHDPQHAPVIGSPDISNSQHPGNNSIANDKYDADPDTVARDFTRAEGLLATIYEALRKKPELFARTLLLITYDEHGGLYDHVRPETPVPDPGHESSLLRQVFRTIYRRQTAPFDFHMLGVRVPTIAVSPLIEKQTVCTTVRDHASVPSTLRALFAPTADPLTPRDAWSPPFHEVVTRTTARTDLPDLSKYVMHPEVPAATAIASGAPTPVSTAATTSGHVPHHYEPFVKMSDRVRRKLRRRNTPEASRLVGVPALQRAQLTTQAFALRAHRTRAK